MLKEAQIILPTHAWQAENKAAHAALKSELLTLWGGFTATAAQGGWRDNHGKDCVEPVTCYTVAMADNEANAALLREVAMRAGQGARQTAMYVRYASGEVDIVEVEPVAPAVAA